MVFMSLLIVVNLLFKIIGGIEISGIPNGCQQPPKTAMLIYNKSEKQIGTQTIPAGECECPFDPTNKILFFNPVASKLPTTGPKAGASTINMHCEKIENFCVCDEKDVCWKLENAYAEIVINAYCDTGIIE